MRKISILLLILIVFLQSCGLNEREKKIKAQQAEIVKKEQQLILWGQRLKMKEQQLEYTKQSLDSAKKQIDFVGVKKPLIIGKWAVKMSCIETTCEGSALGDTKTEQWNFSYNGNTIVVKAYSGKVLTRIYVGTYKDHLLHIIDEQQNSGVMISAMLKISNNRMDGKREIVQKDCKIVYSLTAEKLK
ncbi:hypothetical protein [Pedobacter frigoris]|uniref:Uncharacterized protein n=1 Tax=Pedobacter frigoris TaxID=2571272 RepID=A0A4U1CRA6_9SPHI|nr:hypothetical protein [Pedobacter frigoris]TKC09395.1 hypothetical protein FA047_04680 [Pedobacter frigoris]